MVGSAGKKPAADRKVALQKGVVWPGFAVPFENKEEAVVFSFEGATALIIRSVWFSQAMSF